MTTAHPLSGIDTAPGVAGPRDRRTPRRRRTRALAAALAAVTVIAGSAYVVGEHAGLATGRSLADRRAEVAARGALVMPFDLDRTTHVFTPTPGGGRQTVTADDPADTEQVRLIREHLGAEQAAFARGDFSDPAVIHGQDMPGLRALQSGYRRFQVAYGEVPGGALLTYTTTDPALVEALHQWYRAQLSDHGSHAEGSHP